MLTPVASVHGRTVAESIATGTPASPADSIVPTTVFTVPQLASVGLTEAEANADSIPYRVTKVDFEYLGAAIIDDDRDGLVKLLFAEDDDRLIGAHIAAPDAANLIQAMAVAISAGMTARELRTIPGIHPAYSEALNWASTE
jgi:pyruvate/2-oxoglutarate dehydrogenase complex dihydrolipoamide dehydrogenase (E3) component